MSGPSGVGIVCVECRQSLMVEGLELVHGAGMSWFPCPNAGRRFKFPTIRLQEAGVPLPGQPPVVEYIGPRTCEHCRWWKTDEQQLVGVGHCHKNAPALFQIKEDGWPITFWPTTIERDLCGEFQPSPTINPPAAIDPSAFPVVGNPLRNGQNR